MINFGYGTLIRNALEVGSIKRKVILRGMVIFLK